MFDAVIEQKARPALYIDKASDAAMPVDGESSVPTDARFFKARQYTVSCNRLLRFSPGAWGLGAMFQKLCKDSGSSVMYSRGGITSSLLPSTSFSPGLDGITCTRLTVGRKGYYLEVEALRRPCGLSRHHSACSPGSCRISSTNRNLSPIRGTRANVI